MSLTDDQKSLLRKALAHAQNPDDAQILCIYLIHHAEWHRLKFAVQFIEELRANDEAYGVAFRTSRDWLDAAHHAETHANRDAE